MWVNPNLTEVIAILDRSGSMADSVEDVIGGYNSLIARQRELPGECRATLVTFADDVEVVYEDAPIVEVPRLTKKKFFASGSTRLADAIGMMIVRAGKRYDGLPFDRRPGNVVVFISTDGQENASKEYRTSQVRGMVQHQQERYNWHFVFTGANIDSYTAGAQFGFDQVSILQHASSPIGVRSLYGALSAKVSQLRSGKVQCMSFSPQEKEVVERHAKPVGSFTSNDERSEE